MSDMFPSGTRVRVRIQGTGMSSTSADHHPEGTRSQSA